MKQLFAAFFVLLCFNMARAQSLSFTLNQQPCNNNGIVTITVSGLTNPVTLTYYIGASPGIVHTITSGNTDVLTGYSGEHMSVQATSAGNPNGVWNNYAAPAFSVGVNPSITALCPNPASVLATVSGGAAPYSYNWRNSTTNITASTTNPANLHGGSYDLIVTDNNGCTVTLDSGIYVYSQAPFQVNTSTTVASCTNGTASATVSGSGLPPYSYLWDNSATSSTITNLTQGWYNVTVTDANGCYVAAYANVQQSVTINANVVPTPATCIQTNGGVASYPTGGMPPYTYLWDNLATTQVQTGIASGDYSVTVTDANGCTGTGYAQVKATTPVNVTYTSTASSCTSPTGSATLTISGGATPYSVLWNTFPAQTGITASNLLAGTYSFKVTDANGCIRTGSAVIPPVSVINASISSVNPTCTQSNGSVSVSASGGATPYTYLWNNSAVTSGISGLATGTYTVAVTDNLGCSITKSAYLSPSSPVSIGLATTAASCIYTNNGAITATALGGTAPYTWNTTSGTNTITNLATGYYSIGVTDANGCKASSYTFVPYNTTNSSCYCTITGTVYHDANNNCVKDAGENGIPNIQMHLSGFGYAYTNASGVYSFKVPTGSYTLSESVQALYPLATCQNNSISVNAVAATGCIQTYNFANTINPLHDVKVNTWNYNCPVPGYTYNTVTIISNDGTVAEPNIVAGYNNDVQLPAPTILPSAVWANTGGSQYNINTSANLSLAPGISQAFYMDHSIPTNMPLNTLLTMKDTAAYSAPMSNWLNDYTPANNVDYFNSTVVGSYDPNFKEVSPAGDGPGGNIYAKDSILDYMVHFQNLGTYQAFNIVVLDTLDADLDWTSFKPGYKSHPCTVTISETGVVKYTFSNINLPPKMQDELLSNGMFTYSIKTKRNLPLGTQFTNSAAIYFDFNEPVITNTTLNTLSAPSHNNDLGNASGPAFTLYPNPATDICYLKFKISKEKQLTYLKITDVTGKLMTSMQLTLNAGDHMQSVSTTGFTSGIYFVTLASNGIGTTQKLVIVR
jgi:hypothetical protein